MICALLPVKAPINAKQRLKGCLSPSQREALARLMEGKTSMVIAHKLPTIQSADVIFVVSDGEIVERGRHEELMEKGGRYSELHALQFWFEGVTA